MLCAARRQRRRVHMAGPAGLSARFRRDHAAHLARLRAPGCSSGAAASSPPSHRSSRQRRSSAARRWNVQAAAEVDSSAAGTGFAGHRLLGVLPASRHAALPQQSGGEVQRVPGGARAAGHRTGAGGGRHRAAAAARRSCLRSSLVLQQFPSRWLQAFDAYVTVREARPASNGVSLKHPWRRSLHCRGSSCALTVPAVGQADFVVLQPGGGTSPPPDPCTLEARLHFAPGLLASVMAGAALLLGSHRAVASSAGQAAIRLGCSVAPVAAGYKLTRRLLLAALAGAAGLTIAADHVGGAAAEARR